MTPRARVIVGAIACAALALTPRGPHRTRGAEACGYYPTTQVFVPLLGPEDPEAFARGALGVVHGTYRVQYLVAAYRHLSGAPLGAEEQTAVLTGGGGLDAGFGFSASNERWHTVRAGVKPNATRVPAWANNGDYQYFLNCPDDAFDTAVRLLERRIATLGADHPNVVQWTLAQDQVFANCGRDGAAAASIPADLPATAPAAARADRGYQIAAAHFYAGHWPEARRRFLAIDSDATSSWRPWGRYLASRALLRQASLATEPDAALLGRAEQELRAIAGDPSLADRRSAALGLAEWAATRARPEATFMRMAATLVQPTDAPAFARAVPSYRHLFASLPAQTLQKAEVHASDLNDWILTLRGGSASIDKPALALPARGRPSPEADHAVARWKATGSVPWLVAATTLLPPGHPQEAEILEAAASVPAASPAYATLGFHRLRLLLHEERIDAARALLGRLRAEARPLPAAFDNQLRAAAFLAATSFDELLAAGPRRELGQSSGDWSFASDEHIGPGEMALADDAIDVLNERLPLALLQRAADSLQVPEIWKRRLARAVFTRALVIDDVPALRAATPRFVAFYPELTSQVEGLLAAAAEVRRDEAALLLAFRPGLRPFVERGTDRGLTYVPGSRPAGSAMRTVPTPLTELGAWRDNWWCAMTPIDMKGGVSETVAPYESGPYQRYSHRLDRIVSQLYENPEQVPWPSFLTTADRRQTEAEWTLLRAGGAAPTFFGRRVVQWARTHPTDPRAPEALHRVVRATRFGCSDDGTSAVSRAAFQLLHRRYPKSEWAARTKYWY